MKTSFITSTRKWNRTMALLEHALSLLVVFFMLVAATLWTGRLFGHDIGISKSAQSGVAQSKLAVKPTDAQLKQMGINPQQVKLKERDSASWNVRSSEGSQAMLGTVISTDPYAHADQGFAGPTPLYIYIDGQGKVCQIVAADNADTPHFFNNAFSHITPQYVGKTAEEATQVKVDAVTGATFSSRAIIANVQKSLASYSSASASADKAPAIGWGKGIAVVIVLLLGAGISLLFRGNRPLRVVQLVLNVLVLGFWCGQFLSLSLLRGWIANGIDVGATWPTLLVLIVAIAMPLIKNKHYYCTWICPYGSLQELTSRLPFPKIHCSAAVYRWMSRVRMTVFCLLMLLLWAAFWGGEVLDYEPFTAFLFTTAMPAVIILAAAFVLASCFVPRLWCRSLCPMGQLLDFAEDSTSRKAPILKNKCKTLIQKNK